MPKFGFVESPRYFFGYLTKKFEAQGLRQSKLDPCLFYGKDLLLITYVDDVLIYAKRKEDIADLIARLKKMMVVGLLIQEQLKVILLVET